MLKDATNSQYSKHGHKMSHYKLQPITKHGYDFEILPAAIKTMSGSVEFFF